MSQQECCLQQRLVFVQDYHKNHQKTTEVQIMKEYKPQNPKPQKPKEEEQPKLSLQDNLNRINSLYKAVSQPRIEAKEVQPPQYFYNFKQPEKKADVVKSVKENQNIKTFLSNNQLSLKDYDLKQNRVTSNTPLSKQVRSPQMENKVSRTDSTLSLNGAKSTPKITFMRGIF